MHNLNTFQSITERDIDLLVLEELNVSDEFAHWLVCRVKEEVVSTHIVGAWHSVVDTLLGESDLVFIYQLDDLANQAVLIENKIDAEAQPAQGERYQRRGQKGVDEGLWQDFRTCLVAPKAYINKNAECYDAYITYEEIMAYFVAQGDRRSLYRAQTIKDAIDKNRRGYCATICPKTTEFARQYLAYVAANFPQLNPEPSKPRAAGHNWIHFYPVSSNKQVRIIHQIYGKSVKLQLLGQAENFEQVRAQFYGLETSGFRIVKSGKSVNVEISVPEINIAVQPFEASMTEIETALGHILALHSEAERSL